MTGLKPLQRFYEISRNSRTTKKAFMTYIKNIKIEDSLFRKISIHWVPTTKETFPESSIQVQFRGRLITVIQGFNPVPTSIQTQNFSQSTLNCIHHGQDSSLLMQVASVYFSHVLSTLVIVRFSFELARTHTYTHIRRTRCQIFEMSMSRTFSSTRYILSIFFSPPSTLFARLFLFLHQFVFSVFCLLFRFLSTHTNTEHHRLAQWLCDNERIFSSHSVEYCFGRDGNVINSLLITPPPSIAVQP